MTSEIVKNWFGEEFSNLAPELQELHLHGGVLRGKVEMVLGRGVAGVVGQRIAKKMNIPNPGINDLIVRISHSEGCLNWDRQFNKTINMKSTFEPIKTIRDGYWIEKTGSLEMMLTVDIKDQGWHWRCLRFKYHGIPMPLWFFPELKAYKHIEDGRYKFYVGFRAPLVGQLFSYSGLLERD